MILGFPPLVIFPEGTTTNGHFLSMFQQYFKN